MFTRSRAVDRPGFAQFGRVGLLPEAVRSRWPEALAVGALALAWLALRNIPLSHDVVWQMWIARQMLGGARLYVDILEVNPPLWFWMALPVQEAAQSLGIAPKQAMVTAVFGLILVSMLVLAALLSGFGGKRRAVLLGLGLAATIVLPLTDFGQREHLALIVAIPYAFLAARRAQGNEVHWLLALLVGVLAAPGFALKHYFLAVPLFLDLWILRERRRGWNPFRPETLALAAAAMVYAAAIWLQTPDFLTSIVPTVSLAYFGYDGSLLFQLFKPFIVFWIFAALICRKWRSLLPAEGMAAAIAGAAFVLSYFLQQKGFNYHALAATGMLFIAVGSLSNFKDVDRTWRRVVAGTMAMPVLVTMIHGTYFNRHEGPVLQLLAGTERSRPVMMLAANPSAIWPMVDDEGYVWPSRHFAIWMLTSFARELRELGHLSPALEDYARVVRAQTVTDLACNPPDVILVDDLRWSKAEGIDAVAFFSQDEDFRAFFSHYAKARVVENFTSYRKDPSWTPLRPASCRTIH